MIKQARLRLGINGLGRIGRLVARIALCYPQIDLTAINSRSSVDICAYLLKHDTTYGLFSKKIKAFKKALVIDGQKILFFQENDPQKIDWQKAKVAVVIESTGKFRTFSECQKHLKKGVRLVIISAPAKDNTPTYILGVNEQKYDPLKERIISSSSCTTNCVAPVLKVLDEKFKLQRGFMTTVHALTRTQSILDGSSKKEVRLGRAGIANIIPASTGAAKDIGKVLPHLKEKIICQSLRVPLVTVSLAELVVKVFKKTDVNEVNLAFKKAAQGSFKGVLEVADEEVVSSDLIGPHSAVIDPFLTRTSEDLVKVSAWYDNEWGYSARLVDLAVLLFEKGRKRHGN